MKAANTWQCGDFRRGRRPRPDGHLVWGIFVQPEVAAVCVVVGDIRSDKPNKMAPAEDDDVLEEFAASAADPAFRHWVLPRTAVGYPTGLEPIALTASTTAGPKIVSRSNMRCLGAVSYGNDSRSC